MYTLTITIILFQIFWLKPLEQIAGLIEEIDQLLDGRARNEAVEADDVQEELDNRKLEL